MLILMKAHSVFGFLTRGLRLPLAYNRGQPVKTENPPPDDGQAETPKRILLIEDQELNRKVVRIVLQSKGY